MWRTLDTAVAQAIADLYTGWDMEADDLDTMLDIFSRRLNLNRAHLLLECENVLKIRAQNRELNRGELNRVGL